jgi:hypothetical protein
MLSNANKQTNNTILLWLVPLPEILPLPEIETTLITPIS